MNPIYKLMNSEYVDTLLTGKQLRIGTLDYYRGIEHQGIGDKNEGNTTFHAEHIARDRYSDEDWQTIKGNLNQIISLGDNVIVQDCIFSQNNSNQYIFCASTNISKTTISKMREDSEKIDAVPYDVAVPILNPRNFAVSVQRELSPLWRFGVNPNTLLEKVSYTGNLRNLTEVQTKHPAFYKNQEFKDQSEFRFIFLLNVESGKMHTTINAEFPPGTIGKPIRIDSILRSKAS